MTVIDLFLAFVLLAAISGGYRLGFLTRVGGWVGLLAGLALAVPFVGPAVSLFEGSSQIVRLAVAALVVVGLGAIGQGIGTSLGLRLRFRVARGPLRAVDGVGGAVAGVFGTLVIVWLLLPSLSLVPGGLSLAVRESAIIGFVDERAPEPPIAARELAQRVSDFEFPPVFAGMQAAPQTGPPPSELPIPPAVVDRVSVSTVNVEAPGCGGIKEGSGFVVETDLVATNAHVVAGTGAPQVRLTDGSTRAADVVVFDDDRDLALLSVPGLGRPPLPLDDAVIGEGAGAFGHPGGQDQLRVAPANVEDRIDAVGRDIYNRDRVRRQVLVLAAELQRGDSGGAVVDADGNVIGVVFAVAPDRRATAYALTVAELRAVLAAEREAGASTGRCN